MFGSWQVEAKNPNGDFHLVSSLSQEGSRKLHSELSNSGEWASVRSFDSDSASLFLEKSHVSSHDFSWLE